MEKLWEPKKPDRLLDAETWKEWDDVLLHSERYLPYKRLYQNLSRSQLLELIKDAWRFHWEALDLRKCGLDALPKVLFYLPDLRVLALGNWTSVHPVSGARNSFSVLPVSVGELKNLQSLDLLGTDITSLPKSIGNLSNLRTIELQEVKIRSLPDSIGKLSNLRELSSDERKKCTEKPPKFRRNVR